MKHVDSIALLRELRDSWRAEGLTVGFVPTMGALHAGHLSLVGAALARCQRVVVSIFVNPTQFGPGEDLDRYPRDLDGDKAKLADAGCHAVFTTDKDAMYPEGFCTWVSVEGLTDALCGAKRPGHFRGVTTVVTKLLQLVDPDDAFFGEKDRQQLVVLQRMARDLNLRPRVHGCPIVREPDGLALSSRNVFLKPEERITGLQLSTGLRRATEAYADGQRDPAVLRALVCAGLEGAGATIDYVEVVSLDTLRAVEVADDRTLIAVAAFVGETRLIDNHLISRPFPA